MDILSLCQSSTQLGGAVTFTLLPFRTIQSEAAIDKFRRLVPSERWVHRDGRIAMTLPPEHQRALEKLEKGVTAELLSDWTWERLWAEAENAFALLPPMTVNIQFHDMARLDVRLLRAFWSEREAPLEARWQAFQYLSADVFNAWWAAFYVTRDTSLLAPKDPDPNAGAGEPPTNRRSPAASPKPSRTPSTASASASASPTRTTTPTP